MEPSMKVQKLSPKDLDSGFLPWKFLYVYF